MKIFRIIAFLVLVASGAALAQESTKAAADQSPEVAATTTAGQAGESPIARYFRELAEKAKSGDAEARAKLDAWAAWAALDEEDAWIDTDEERAEEERRRQLEAAALSVETASRVWAKSAEEAKARREAQAASDARIQAHMQQVAARKSQEWQNQLWLWQAQREAQAQQQYQQQLLHQLRSEQVRRQWFRRDLVRAIDGLAPPTCYWSFTKQRNVCY